MSIDWAQYQIEQAQREQEAARLANIHAAAVAEEERRRQLRIAAEKAMQEARNKEQQRLVEQERQRMEQELFEQERQRKQTQPEIKSPEEQQKEIQQVIANSPIKLQIAYQRGGPTQEQKLAAYNAAVNEWNKGVYKQRLENKLATEKLNFYQKDKKYNVSQFVQDNPKPDTIKTLEKAGFDKDTLKAARDYVYGLRKAETAFNNKNKSLQVFTVGQALGFKARQKASKSDNVLASLNEKDKQKVLEEFIKSDISPRELRHQSLELLKQEYIEAAPIYGLAILAGVGTVATGVVATTARILEYSALAAMGGYTAYETITNWDELNNKQRALYLAVAALMVAPGGRALIKRIELKVDPLGTKATEFIKSTQRKSDAKMEIIIRKQFGNEGVNKINELNKAQNQYITELVKQMKGKSNKASRSGIKLEKVAKEYTEIIKKNIKTDEPLGEIGIRRQIEDMPKNIRENIKSMLESKIPTKQKLKMAQVELKKANANLEKARAKWPTKPDKWADLVLEQAIKENQYKLLRNKATFNYQADLIRMRARLNELETVKFKSKRERLLAVKEKNRLERKIKESQEKYDKYLKSMPVEYGRGGEVSGRGGRISVLTTSKPRVRSSFKDALNKEKIGFRTIGGGVISASKKDIEQMKGLQDFTVKSPLRMIDVEKEVKEINLTRDLTQSEIKSITESLNKLSQQAKVSLVTRQAIQESIRSYTETGALTKPQTLVQQKAGEVVKTKTKIKEKEEFEGTKKEPPPPPLSGDKDEKKKPREIKESLGAVTYRRGELNNMGVWHTYHVDKNGVLQRSIVVGPPPEGATVATGKGSTTTTLKLIRGKKVPNFTVLADTGAVDDVISASGGKLTLSHVPDRISGGGMKRLTNGIGRLSPKIPKLR